MNIDYRFVIGLCALILLAGILDTASARFPSLARLKWKNKNRHKGAPNKGTYILVTVMDEGPHAWNIVKLDGKWYEVDC